MAWPRSEMLGPVLANSMTATRPKLYHLKLGMVSTDQAKRPNRMPENPMLHLRWPMSVHE